MDSLYIGIDVAKANCVAAAQGPAGESLWGEFANTPAGFEQWRARVCAAVDEQLTPGVVVVLEPTGGYELGLAGFAAAQGWQVSRPNALRVHDWANRQGRRAKTDRQDARILARYGAAQPLAAWKPLPRAYSELESLLQRQDDLDSMLQQERNRQAALELQAGTASVVAVSLAAVLLSLETAQREIQLAIKAHLKAHPVLKAKKQRLLSVPGIGRQTVLHVLVLLARWETLTDGTGRAKGLVAYTGLDPQTHDSGSSVHKPARISAWAIARCAADCASRVAAFGGVRACGGPLRDFYGRLVGRGQAKKLALIAAARKILIWAWAVYRTEKDFDPKRHVQPEPQPA